MTFEYFLKTFLLYYLTFAKISRNVEKTDMMMKNVMIENLIVIKLKLKIRRSTNKPGSDLQTFYIIARKVILQYLIYEIFPYSDCY